MFVVDTNVLLYAANADAAEHTRCRQLLEEWRTASTPWYLTWGIVYEFLRVSTHRRAFGQPLNLDRAWTFLKAVISAESAGILTPTQRHASIADEVFGAIPDLTGNLLFDAHIAILMREHGIRVIYTRDTDFNRFPFLEVVDPLTGLRRTPG